MRIRSNDIVKILAGNERGKQGKVLKIDNEGGKVLVEGINKVWRHVRRSQRNPQGGRLHKEMPVRISNVQVICPACQKPTRLGARTSERGKERYCKKCGAGMGAIAPPKVPAAQRLAKASAAR
jgi:large subunit ribosomal protein L24